MTATPLTEGASLESLVAQVVDDFLERQKRGEQPNPAEYAARHPHAAVVLREVLAALHVVGLSSSAHLAAVGGAAAAEGPVAGTLGDFRILREVGRGGMGVVYEAEQISLSRRVALKVLPFAAAMDAKQLQRFKNEAQAAAQLHHTNIVPVYYVGCERGVHFYAMQFIEGQSLAQVIADLRLQSADWQKKTDSHDAAPAELAVGENQSATPDSQSAICNQQSAITPTPPVAALSTERSNKTPGFFRTVANLGVQAAGGLEHAHQLGVVHRDIKPANLLVDARGNLWVTDFGLAQCQGQAGLTLTGDFVGTLRYMSPEQASAKRGVVDHRTDIYSLGVTLYELLTLEPAYAGRDRVEVLQQISAEEPRLPRRLNPAVPAELETIVLKALAKNPEERYATAQEVADDLQRFLDDKPIKAKRPMLRQRMVKWARRHKTVVRAALVVLVLTVAALAVSTALIWQAKNDVAQAKNDVDRANVGLSESLERERQNAYYQRIALADREWSANNLGRMEQLLEECRADLRGWEWHYLKRLRYKTLSPLYDDSVVFCVAFSRTGHYLASGNQDGVIKIWDARTGQPFRNFRAGEKIVRSVAFSPDGQRLAAARSDGSVKIWDLQADKEPLVWKPHSSSVTCVVFSPEGGRLASSCFSYGWEGEPPGGEVKVWDAADGKEIFTFRGQPLGVLSVAFSPDGQRLASAGEDKTVTVLEARTGRELWTSPYHTAPVAALAYSPDGQSLASAGANWSRLVHAEVTLWDTRTGKERFTLGGHIGYILSVAFSPDGRRLASAGMDRTVKLWDVATGRETLTLRGHKGAIHAVAFSPDGRQLASASSDQTVRVWDATPLEEKAGEEPLTLRVHPPGVLGVAFHPDGQRLASVADDGGVKLWDSRTGKPILTFPDSQGFWSIAFSPDGQRLAAGGRRSEVKVWDVRSGQELLPLHGFSNLVKRVAFNPDSRHLVSAQWDRTVRVWDTAIGQEVFQIPAAHAIAIWGLALSPDGKSVVTASADGTKVWDMATGRHIVTLQPPHPGHPTCVAFRSDGQLLASASVDGTIKLWDTQSWKQQGDDLRDTTGGVYSLAFSPDGRLLSWGSTDATVKVWDVRTKEIQSLRGHTSWVEDVAFSPDGKRIASASLDGTVKLWQVPFVPEARAPAAGAPGLAPEGRK